MLPVWRNHGIWTCNQHGCGTPLFELMCLFCSCFCSCVLFLFMFFALAIVVRIVALCLLLLLLLVLVVVVAVVAVVVVVVVNSQPGVPHTPPRSPKLHKALIDWIIWENGHGGHEWVWCEVADAWEPTTKEAATRRLGRFCVHPFATGVFVGGSWVTLFWAIPVLYPFKALPSIGLELYCKWYPCVAVTAHLYNTLSLSLPY